MDNQRIALLELLQCGMTVAIYDGEQRIVVKTQYSDIFVVEDSIFKAIKADGGLLAYLNVESSDTI